ncbi:MAG TPA: hypothetical protein VKA83_00010 [Methylomirabilota bacterium]|nr:hypothetical protein [Methylomirabilota bacterium]
MLEQEIDDADRQAESLRRTLRRAARVRVDGLECEIGEEAEVEAGVLDGRGSGGEGIRRGRGNGCVRIDVAVAQSSASYRP